MNARRLPALIYVVLGVLLLLAGSRSIYRGATHRGPGTDYTDERGTITVPQSEYRRSRYAEGGLMLAIVGFSIGAVAYTTRRNLPRTDHL